MKESDKDLLSEFDSDYNAMHQLRNGNKRLLSMLLILMAINIFICPLLGIGTVAGCYTQNCFDACDWLSRDSGGTHSVVFTLIPYRDFSYVKKYYQVFLITMLVQNTISFVGRTARLIIKLIL